MNHTDPQLRNQKIYRDFATCEAACFAVCGESLLILIAIHFGFGDAFSTMIGSFLYQSYLVLPAGYYFAAKMGVAKSIAFQTMISVLGVLFMILAVLIFGISRDWAGCLLTFGTVLFFFTKSSASAIVFPLQANISNNQNRPHMLGEIAAWSHAAALLTTLAVSLILHLFKNEWTYPGLLIGGGVLGVLGALRIRTMKEPEILRQIAGRPILPQILLSWRDPGIRKQLILGVCLNLSLIMLIPVEMLAVKRGGHFSDSHVTALWAVKVVASIAGASLWSFLTRRFGSGKVISGSALLIPLLCLYWLAVPMQLLSWTVFLPFLISGLMVVFYSNSLMDVFMQTVLPRKQQGGSLLVLVVTGGIAGVAGIGLNAFIFSVLEYFRDQGTGDMFSYRLYFLTALLFFLPVVFLIKKFLPESVKISRKLK